MLNTEKRSVGVITAVAMFRMLGLFALLPVLSLYAAGLEGATPLLVGMAVGAFGLTQAGLQVPMGAVSDRVGRIPVILAGLAVFAIGSAVAAMADTIHGVILGRLLQGAGAISATLTALVADVTRPEVRTRSMAIIGIGIGTSFLVAMIFGPALAASLGVRALFWFGVLVAVVSAGLLLTLPGRAQQPAVRTSWDLRPALRADLLRLDFYVFLLHAVLTAMFVALPFLLTNTLSLPITEHWKMYVGALLLSLPGTILLIVRDERQGKGLLIGTAVLLLCISHLLLTFGGFHWAMILLALMLFFSGFNFLEASLPARLSVLADNDARGASLGVFSMSQFLGAFTGGLLGGRFMAGGRPGDVFFVCMLLAAIWLALQSFGRFRHE